MATFLAPSRRPRLRAGKTSQKRRNVARGLRPRMHGVSHLAALRVLLKTDPTQPMFDRFNRLLAYVRLPSGRQLNRAQVAAGWAKVLVVGRRFQYYGEFRRLARRAKRQ